MYLKGSRRLPRWQSGEEFTCQFKRHRRHGLCLWVGKIPWSRKWQPTLVFLPGESHGQRNLVGYSPWGRKESDTTEWLSMHRHKGSRGSHGKLFVVPQKRRPYSWHKSRSCTRRHWYTVTWKRYRPGCTLYSMLLILYNF